MPDDPVYLAEIRWYAPLEPLHDYAIEEVGSTNPPTVTFTTGEGPDSVGPPRLVLRDIGGGYWPRPNDCGRSMYLIPEVSSAPVDAFS